MALVGELAEEVRAAEIADGAGEPAIADQARDVERRHPDRNVGHGERVARAAEEVGADRFDPRVRPRDARSWTVCGGWKVMPS